MLSATMACFGQGFGKKQQQFLVSLYTNIGRTTLSLKRVNPKAVCNLLNFISYSSILM